MRLPFETMQRLRAAPSSPAAGPNRLTPLAAKASNPGNLKAWCHVPEGRSGMPLVVVLHGCTQTAAGYDAGSGWSTLAERHGFAVLLPEQQRANNPNLCFNWFSPADVRRGQGEVLSIREMVALMVDDGTVDPARVFVTGLSAGGAMTAAMLATYPEVFAGGAIVAGLPFGAAFSVPQALERMRGQGHADAGRYAAQVRDASDHRGPWPTISVWHGTADATVASGNADAILEQWLQLHELERGAYETDTVDGAVRRTWRNGAGQVCVEDHRIAGMGHGTPIATTGARAAGSVAPYMLDVGISSTWHIASGWGLLDPAVETAEPPRSQVTGASEAFGAAQQPSAPNALKDTIEAAFRSAGLMR